MVPASRGCIKRTEAAEAAEVSMQREQRIQEKEASPLVVGTSSPEETEETEEAEVAGRSQEGAHQRPSSRYGQPETEQYVPIGQRLAEAGSGLAQGWPRLDKAGRGLRPP